jgi:hypothetical protein
MVPHIYNSIHSTALGQEGGKRKKEERRYVGLKVGQVLLVEGEKEKVERRERNGRVREDSHNIAT